MTISESLKWSTNLLSNSGIKTSRLDSLVLLAKVTGLRKAGILAHDDLLLTNRQNNLFKELVSRRARHIPVTQLTESCEFYGRNFYVNRFVMSPRPETEKMIDIFLALIQKDKDLKSIEKISAADIGTGCGAIGITIKKECPNVDVDLTDVDAKALKVAKINVVINTLNVNVIESNLICNLRQKYQVLFCNLPYVPDGFKINEEARNEPRLAIFGGKDGLDMYRQLFDQVSLNANKPLLILTEALPFSKTSLAEIAINAGYTEVISKDFIQVFKHGNKANNIKAQHQH